MQSYPRTRPIGPTLKKSKTKSDPPREITVDDVIGALLDLFDKLKIDASQFASRVKSLEHKTLPSKLYSHTAAIGELLTAWHQSIQYLDSLGNPMPIKMRGKKASFYSLAKNAVPNMQPSALLTELERAGAVTIDKDGYIHVRMRSLHVYEDKRHAVQYTLTSLNSFITTLRHNLDSDPSNSDQLFHRVAWNGEFDPRLIPALKIKIRRQGNSFLEAFDNWMMRKSNQVRRSKPRGRRKPVQIFIGVYLATDGKLAPRKSA
jgi:beta-galactosidase GanA